MQVCVRIRILCAQQTGDGVPSLKHPVPSLLSGKVRQANGHAEAPNLVPLQSWERGGTADMSACLFKEACASRQVGRERCLEGMQKQPCGCGRDACTGIYCTARVVSLSFSISGAPVSVTLAWLIDGDEDEPSHTSLHCSCQVNGIMKRWRLGPQNRHATGCSFFPLQLAQPAPGLLASHFL